MYFRLIGLCLLLSSCKSNQNSATAAADLNRVMAYSKDSSGDLVTGEYLEDESGTQLFILENHGLGSLGGKYKVLDLKKGKKRRIQLMYKKTQKLLERRAPSYYG